MDLLLHQIKRAIRNLKGKRFNTLINLIGLSIAFTFGLFLSLHIYEEESYEKSFSDSEHIYRVNADFLVDDSRNVYSNAPRPVIPNMVNDMPEIESGLRIYGVGGLEVHTGILKYDEKNYETDGLFIADSTFFEFFDYPLLAKSLDKPLSEPNSLVISSELSKRLFGEESAIGKEIIIPIGDARTYKITGVFEKGERKTHLKVDALISYISFYGDWELDRWFGAHVYSYIKLNPNSEISSVEAREDAFYEKYMKSTFDPINGSAQLHFQPIQNIHLDDELIWEPEAHGDRENIQILKIVVILLLVFSIINYVNLTTASASDRFLETGIRKVLGSEKRYVFSQFIIEASIISICALILAFALIFIGQPLYTSLTNIEIDLRLINSPIIIGLFFLIAITTGIISGLYPAIHMSSLNTMFLLKADNKSLRSAVGLRKVLVFIQYVFTAFLISAVLIVWQQSEFIKNRELGYNPENVILVKIQSDTSVYRNIDKYKTALEEVPEVRNSTVLNFALNGSSNEFAPTLELPSGEEKEIAAEIIDIDRDFINTLSITLNEGENLDYLRETEFGTVLINRAMVDQFEWLDDPLNTKFIIGWLEDEDGNERKWKIAGVVEDFYIGKSYRKVEPMVILPNWSNYGTQLAVKFEGDLNKESIQKAETRWNALFPDYPFEYKFLEDDLMVQYAEQDQFFGQLALFSMLLIFISSLGIIGMISSSIKSKQKEIAIRKILGSDEFSLYKLLTNHFGIMILLANLIALPINYYFAKMWLEEFAHRIDYSASPILSALGICIAFTATALFYHLRKVKLSNPVDFLRQE